MFAHIVKNGASLVADSCNRHQGPMHEVFKYFSVPKRRHYVLSKFVYNIRILMFSKLFCEWKTGSSKFRWRRLCEAVDCPLTITVILKIVVMEERAPFMHGLFQKLSSKHMEPFLCLAMLNWLENYDNESELKSRCRP